MKEGLYVNSDNELVYYLGAEGVQGIYHVEGIVSITKENEPEELCLNLR